MVMPVVCPSTSLPRVLCAMESSDKPFIAPDPLRITIQNAKSAGKGAGGAGKPQKQQQQPHQQQQQQSRRRRNKRHDRRLQTPVVRPVRCNTVVYFRCGVWLKC